MKTIYLHIGTHKTGSTSIQRFLSRADEALAEQGILYPETGRPNKNWSPYGQHKLQWAITGRRGMENARVWEDLHREIGEHSGQKVILSAESFEKCTSEEIQKTVDNLTPHSIRVVVYLRPPVQFLRSAYAQRVKAEGYQKSFIQCVGEMIQRCNYLNLVSRWEQFEEIEAVDINLFDKAKDEPGLEASFADTVGINFDGIKTYCGPSANVSPPDEIVQVIRWINKLAGFRGKNEAWQALMSRVRSNIMGERWPGVRLIRAVEPLLEESLVSGRVISVIRDEIGSSHRRFLKKYIDKEKREYISIS